MASASVTVFVVEADGSTRQAKGAVDPAAPWDQIKEWVVKALRLNDPNQWVLTVEPGDGSATFAGYTLRDGDRLYLFSRGLRNKPFELQGE